MARFYVGQRVRVKYVRCAETTCWKQGTEVTIIDIKYGVNLLTNKPYDCTVQTVSGRFACPLFEQLEPLKPELTTWQALCEEFGLEGVDA